MLHNVSGMPAGTTGSVITEELISCWDDRIVQANQLLVAETIILIKTMLKSGLRGDTAWAIYSLCIQAFTAAAHTIHLTLRNFAEREWVPGESCLEQGSKDAWEAEHGPQPTHQGLIWIDFCSAQIFESYTHVQKEPSILDLTELH